MQKIRIGLFVLFAFGALFVPGTLYSFDFAERHRFSPIDIALGRYVFDNYPGYFYIPFVESIDAGDTIDLSSLRLIYARKRCFPLSENPVTGGLIPKTGRDENDLSGELGVSLGAEFGSKITYREVSIWNFTDAKAFTFRDTASFAHESCPRISFPPREPQTEPNIALVRSILMLAGTLDREVILKVDGELSIDLQGKLRSFFEKRFGGALLNLDLEGALKGGVERARIDGAVLSPLKPVAIAPEFINEDIAALYRAIFTEEIISSVENGGGTARRARLTVETVSTQLQNELEGSPSFLTELDLVSPLFTGDRLVRLDLENETHLFAIRMAGKTELLVREALGEL